MNDRIFTKTIMKLCVDIYYMFSENNIFYLEPDRHLCYIHIIGYIYMEKKKGDKIRGYL